MKFPDTKEAESYEVDLLLTALKNRYGDQYEIVSKTEKPDFIIRNIKTNEELGAELTSVYLSDKSVPQKHIRCAQGLINEPYNRTEVEEYKVRIIEAIKTKIKKAKEGYSKDRPIILAIYANEYTSLFLDETELDNMVNSNISLFDSSNPFIEIVINFTTRAYHIIPTGSPEDLGGE